MCQRSDQTWNLYWKMRGKRLAEEAATERFSTWPWATHQTDLKRVLFIIVVWLSMDPCLSVSLVCFLPPPPLCHVSCPRCVYLASSPQRGEQQASEPPQRMLSWPLFYSAMGFGGVIASRKPHSRHRGFFSPHICSAFGLLAWLQKSQTQAEDSLNHTETTRSCLIISLH